MNELTHAAHRIHQLTDLLRQADEQYYLHHHSILPDTEHDALMHELRQLEAQHPELALPQSPTHHVGSDLLPSNAGRKRIRHTVPMLSVANVNTASALEAWMNRHLQATGGKARFMLEHKFDGISVSLIYKEGRLVSASTRGDGAEGNDITQNILQVSQLPHHIPGADVPALVELRGEVVLPCEEFRRINDALKAKGQSPYQNERNAISAMVMTDTPEEFRSRNASVYIWQVIGEGMPESHNQRQYLLEDWGFRTALTDGVFSAPRQLLAAILDHENLRDYNPYRTDGLVIKVEQDSLRNDLRNSARCYDWAIAYKYTPDVKRTRVNFLLHDIGRTGQMSTTAWIDPVRLGGVTVSRVSLNSYPRLRELSLCQGDEVVVSLNGDCIPYIREVSSRASDAKPFNVPTVCPHCGKPLREEEGRLMCDNFHCPARIAKRQQYFAQVMGYKGITEAMLDKLYDAGCHHISAFLLYGEKVLSMAGFTTEAIRKLTAQSEKAARSSAAKLITAFGIPEVGPETAKHIAARKLTLFSLSDIAAEGAEALQQKTGCSSSLCERISSFFREEEVREEVERLKYVA